VIRIPGNLLKYLASKFPELEQELNAAEIHKTSEEFIKRCLNMAVLFAFCFFLIGLGLTTLVKFSTLTIVLVTMAAFFFGFWYTLKYPAVRAIKIQREISKEIIFAGRYIIIELQSGVPIYNAIKSCAKNFELIGKYFDDIIKDVDFGTPLETALNKAIQKTPSQNLRRLLVQILNSLVTGADIAPALSALVDQIVREQLIEVKEYGRKLNPIAMFYMIVAIILPSIGTIMLVIVSIFLGIKLDLSALLSLAGLFMFLQFMFYSIIKSQRPAVEI